MPKINLLEKKKKSTYHSDTPQRELRQKAYNSTPWKKLRITYLKMHPLCEECLKKGKTTPAEHVHHVRSPFVKGQVNWELMLDDKNLESICAVCHAELHNQKEKSPEEVIKELDELLGEKPKASDFISALEEFFDEC